MKKRRIVLASVLKPIDDTRMRDKLGGSIAKLPNTEIHIIGYPSQAIANQSEIRSYPLTKFTRLSISRLIAPAKIFLILYKVKPEVLIITTHELLIVSFLIRILFGAKIIYDVQENYFNNILYSGSFTSFFRYIIAGYVRLKERMLAPSIDHFFLAERSFESDLTFIKGRFTILENKSLQTFSRRSRKGSTIKCLFSGTLSEGTGVFQAVELIIGLRFVIPNITLTIVGYCANPYTLQRLLSLIRNHDYISIIGGNQLVPHLVIQNEIEMADYGLIAYKLTPNVKGSIPTKLYEYLAAQLPIVLQNHQPWIELCKPYQAAITVDFDKPDIKEIAKLIAQQTFYSNNPTGVLWKEEEEKLLKVLTSEILQ